MRISIIKVIRFSDSSLLSHATKRNKHRYIRIYKNIEFKSKIRNLKHKILLNPIKNNILT